MPKAILQGIIVFGLAVFAAGCASSGQKSGGVTTRAYVAEKDRVDQEMQGGNQGYLMGTPSDRGEYKKTRQVYVVEFTKELPDEGGSLVPPARPRTEARSIEAEPPQEPEWAKPVALPAAPRVEEKAAISEGACQDYTVQKGDTLQKISKKFYGSYGKWARIYEANKEKLDDPDHLKVGMKLCVPGSEKRVVEEEENLK